MDRPGFTVSLVVSAGVGGARRAGVWLALIRAPPYWDGFRFGADALSSQGTEPESERGARAAAVSVGTESFLPAAGKRRGRGCLIPRFPRGDRFPT